MMKIPVQDQNSINNAGARVGIYPWFVVLMLMVAYALSFVDRQILSLLVEPIKADLDISDSQIGLLQGLAFALFYTLAGLPIGRLADYSHRRNIIAIGIAVWSLMTFLCSLPKTFFGFFLARMGVGVGEAALSPSAYSMMSDYFPRERIGTAVGIYNVGIYVGAGLALIIGGVLIDAIPAFRDQLPALLSDHVFRDESDIGLSVLIVVGGLCLILVPVYQLSRYLFREDIRNTPLQEELR